MVKPVMLAALSVSLMTSPAFHSAMASAEPQVGTSVPQDPSAIGYLNLHKRHPNGQDGPVEFEYRYSSDAALGRLTRVRGYLGSFRQLTHRARNLIPEPELREMGNTSRKVQTIGVRNLPWIVEGTVLKQDYQLRQVQYELAQLKRERGEMGTEELDRARAAYVEATREYQPASANASMPLPRVKLEPTAPITAVRRVRPSTLRIR